MSFPVAKPSTETNLNSFIGAVHRALHSEMRLAHIDYTLCPVAMVHPDAQVGDEVFYIWGCSVPVVIRNDVKGIKTRYAVIGGAYLYKDMSDELFNGTSNKDKGFPRKIFLC